MREFKFRFWSKILKAIVTPHDVIFRGAFNDPEFVVMQYTGLKDKNGVEIYEGDIIDVAPHMRDSDFVKTLGKNPYLHEVKYTGFTIEPFDYESNDEPSEYEVIGNIYEHPHLLLSKEETSDE